MTELALIAEGLAVSVVLLPVPTNGLLMRMLPFTGTARFWGRMVRIDMPLEAYLEPQPTVLAEPGDVLWSPDLDELLLPYGATPISRRGEIRLPSPSTRIGQIFGDPQALRDLHDGAMITLTLIGTKPARAGKGLADPRRGRGRWLG